MTNRVQPQFRYRESRGRRADLEEIVRISSDKLRQFLFAYLLLITYVVAVVLSTTDRQLLLVDEGLKLPLIDLTVPLPGFYFVIPYLVLALHFNLLQNLSNHHFKLMEWRRSWNGSIPISRISPFIFDFASLGHRTPFFKWVSAVNSFLCLYSAPALITIIMWRFADYQSSAALWAHLAALWIDFYFVSKAQAAFIDNALVPTNNNKSVRATYIQSVKGIIEFLKAPVSARPRSYLSALWFLYLFVITLKILVCWDVFIRDWEESFVRRHFAFMIMQTPDDAKEANDLLGFLPRIAIDKADVLFRPDVARLKALAELIGRETWGLSFETRGMSLDLRGRSLRYLSIPFQVLPRVWMQDAQLQGGNFSFTNLNGSVMVRAQLQGAEFTLAEMEGGFLNGANLRGASLFNARLAGSTFENAALQGADLKYANMLGVFLQDAQLQGADLRGIQLTGAYIDGISIWGILTTGEKITVLTNRNGAAPELIDSPPHPSEIHRWAASFPSWNEEETFAHRMLEGESNNTQFFSLHVDNAGTVKEIVKSACSNGQYWWLSRMTLNRYIEHLTVLRHPVRLQLVSAVSSAKSANKDDCDKNIIKEGNLSD